MTGLRGKVVLVTGGARGIGRATAARFLDEGARVVVADVDGAEADATARALSSRGPITARTLDVTRPEDFEAVVRAIEAELGPIDVLVNNAGIMGLGPLLEPDEAVERRMIELNLFGVLNGMRAVLPGMIARGAGHVVNVASLAGKIGIPRATVYSASKFAVVGVTESARTELVGRGVGFTVVLPYLVHTELTAGTRALAWPPAIEPEDVADALVDGVRRGAHEVYVPRVTRLVAVLPVLLPRALVNWIGRRLGFERLFGDVDAAARAAYVARVRSAAGPAAATEEVRSGRLHP